MNERSIFMTALEKDSPEERSTYLDEACGGDTVLRHRVEALLRSHEQAGAFLGKPAPERLSEGLGFRGQRLADFRSGRFRNHTRLWVCAPVGSHSEQD